MFIIIETKIRKQVVNDCTMQCLWQPGMTPR